MVPAAGRLSSVTLTSSQALSDKLIEVCLYPKLNIFFLRYNIATGVYPFEGDNIYRLFESIGRAEFSVPEDLGEALVSLLNGMLQRDPQDRLSIPQIRRHP